jgi:branched-chain amino acid transport system substrate-binding protein
MRKARTWLAAAIVTLSCIAPAAIPAAMAADAVKIGFVGTFSGPTAAIGNDIRDGFNLGLEHLGRQMAGKPVEVLYEDDTQKPEVGKQKTDKLIESDHVNFLTAMAFRTCCWRRCCRR